MARTTKRAIATIEHDAQALELRKAGLTYERIAEALGFADRSVAWNCVNRQLKATVQEPADDLRKMEGERLDALLRSAWPAAMRGSEKAIAACLSIGDRRAKLFGLDAKTKVDLSGTLQTASEVTIHGSDFARQVLADPEALDKALDLLDLVAERNGLADLPGAPSVTDE